LRGFLPYLRAYIRQANEHGEVVTLHENWKEFALAHSNTPVASKLTKLMEVAAKRSRPGITANIHFAADAPLLDAFDHKEVKFLVDTLVEMGNVKSPNDHYVRLEAKGWELIQSAGTIGIPGKCFVAMWFDESMNEAYEAGIFPALKHDCKMEPIKIDLVPHNDNIINKIIAEIRTCQFMVADFTGHRGGVYFEAGFAKGLGREVIMTCREDHVDGFHFDLRQFSRITWKYATDLREKLADKIKATIPRTT
jgi:hypothetical protein